MDTIFDGDLEEIVFQDVEELKLPEEHCLIGARSIGNKYHTFGYVVPFGDICDTSVIGFKQI